MIFYESPHRLVKTLGQLAEVFGAERPASVSRELTKLFEETVTGTLGSLGADFGARANIKGEIVLVVAGNPVPPARESRAGRYAQEKEDAENEDRESDEFGED